MKNGFHILTIILFGLASISSNAQELNLDHFKSIEARNIGPAGMSGRVTAIDVDLSNDERIFVGTASGGVWLSENGGINWEPIFDKAGIQSIGAIKINQSNPNIIWVGTGEGNPRNSQNSGGGVYRSIDGGKNWKLMGLEKTKVIHRILIDESRDGVVYVGAQGPAWGNNKERGVYKTTDYGTTWDQVLYVNDGTGIGDMVMDPNNPNKIIAAMWEFGRTPAFFNSGGKGSGLYVTFDGGDNWKKLTEKEGLPKGDLGRIGVAFAPSKPSVVYALVEAKENALYRSIDGGANWEKHSTHENMGNRPFYYSEIYVDPHNENRLYSLYTYVSKSEDGGKTFDVIADYGNDVHPDHHAFWIHPNDPNYLIDGNDGGLAISQDQGDTWRFVSNLPVGQFYHVNVDDDFPYNVYGGMQDNGSWVGPGFVLKRGGITNHDWQEIFFGDGFDVAPLPHDNTQMYAMSQGGNLGLTNKNTGLTYYLKPNHPDTVKLRYNWNAALALDPFKDCGVYYGSQMVHYSSDCGQNWKILSPDLTTNDTSKQHQDISGGLTIDATNAENNTTLLAIAPSPVDAMVIWASSDDGRLHITKDGGKNWSDVYSNMIGAPKAGWIPQVQASEGNAAEAFAVVNNYRQNDWSAYLYHTTDFGASWNRIVDDNDAKGFVTSFIQDAEQKNLYFLGTDVGLYFSVDAGTNWQKWDEGFPPVQIRDMAIQNTFGDLVLGTFGRAFWVIDDIGPFRALAKENFRTSEFDIVSCSPAYLAQNRSYKGIRFTAQGTFKGDNKGTNPEMSIWIKPSDDKKESDGKGGKKEKKDDKIKFSVIDSEGDTVRKFSRKVTEKGLLRISWGLEVDGVRGPSRRAIKKDADMPRGGRALPGDYTIVANFGEHSDQINVTVKLDPRLPITKADVAAMKKARKDIEKTFAEAAEGYDRIKNAKKSLALIEKLTETIQDTTKKEFIKINKEHKKELEKLELLFFNKEGLKGIQRNPNVLTATLSTARRYINASHGMPGGNAKIAVAKAKSETKKVLDQVDQYFSSEWSTYQQKMNGVKWDIFD